MRNQGKKPINARRSGDTIREKGCEKRSGLLLYLSAVLL